MNDYEYFEDDLFDLDELAETLGKTGFEYFDGEDEEPKELNF